MCVGIALILRNIERKRSLASGWIGFVLLTIAGSTKENFLFVTVFIVAATVWHYGVRNLRPRDWILVGLASGIWAINVTALAINSNTTVRCTPNRTPSTPR